MENFIKQHLVWLGLMSIFSSCNFSSLTTTSGSLPIAISPDNTTVPASETPPLPQTSNLPLLAAANADSIADAVGVDTHFNYIDTPYATVPAVKANLINSGIRHIRDAAPLQSSAYGALMSDLYLNHGIDQIGGIDPATSDADVIAWIQQNPGVKAFEVCNECDSRSGDWVTLLKTTQLRIFNLIKAHPSVFSGVKLLSPSLISGTDAPSLGDQSAYLDAASLHESVCGANPGDLIGTGAIGFGGFPYATMDFSLAWQSLISGTKPVWITEWGYNDSPPPGDCAIPDNYIAAYEPRSVLEWALRGVPRMYVYQFADQPNDPMFGAEGLVRADGSPKPQYWALKNLIATFSDPGPAFSAAPVPMTITRSASNVHHQVSRKHDGTVLLAIWREAQDYIYRQYTPANLPTTAATVKIDGAFSRGILHVFNMDGSVTNTAITPGVEVSLSLGATIQVVEFNP